MNDLTGPVQSCLEKNVSLKNRSGFGTGGRSDFLFVPDSPQTLCRGIEIFNKMNVPVYVIGMGTNILIHDVGFRGCVICLENPQFTVIDFHDGLIKCGPGVKTSEIVLYALSKHYAGFEFLTGIPGTLGGAVSGNAGDFQKGIGSLVEKLQVVNKRGEVCFLNKNELNFGYRHCKALSDLIITEIYFCAESGDPEIINKKISEIKISKKGKNPTGKTCGSVFKNPDNIKAWEVIEKLGLRGVIYDDVKISEIHPNWIINLGNASGGDIWKCIRMIQKRALTELNIHLELELKLLGNFDIK